MKIILAVLAVLLLAPAGARAQRLQIAHLDRLAERADEVVNVTIDERMLKIFASFIPGNDPEQLATKAFITGLRGIYVRRFVFERAKGYTQDDITTIRKQLTGPSWLQMVTVDKKSDGEVVDVHMWVEGERMTGLAVLVAQPDELTVVNIVGPIDIAKLTALEGLGIPKIPEVRTPAPGGKN